MNKLENAILYSKVDREDYWVNGMVFRVSNTNTFQESFEELREKLQSEGVIRYLKEEFCLLEDLFEGDESFQFDHIYYDNSLNYVFRSSQGDTREFNLQMDYVYLPINGE